MLEFFTLFLTFYVWHALGITIGLHRLLAHRSFSCPKLVEYFCVLAGYLAFEGSPIWWATMHRAHHRHVDTELDLHSPHRGLFHAYVGWMTAAQYPSYISPERQAKDLMKDPLYRFLEQDGNWHRAHLLSFLSCVFFRLIIFFCFGWIAALASALAGLTVWLIPLMLNVVCHMPDMGYKNFASTDDSVNVWWVGLLALGEGWHNNHHIFPGSAKAGIRAHEFDFSWLIIASMKKLGLVKRANVPVVSLGLGNAGKILISAGIESSLQRFVIMPTE